MSCHDGTKILTVPQGNLNDSNNSDQAKYNLLTKMGGKKSKHIPNVSAQKGRM